METLLQCPSCSGKLFSPIIKCVDHTVSNAEFTIVECKTCRLKFTNPRPNEAEIGAYYLSDKYVSHTDSSKGLVDKIYKKIRYYTVNHKIRLLLSLVKAEDNVIDYGAGTGYFVYQARRKNLNIHGFEPSQEARERAQTNYAIKLLSPAEMQNIEEQSIGCITLWHVLEHVHSINETLKRFHSLLKTDGILIIAVPNCDSFDCKHYKKYWAAYDVPRHLYHFNKNTLASLLSCNGFILSGTKPMLFDSSYVSILSEKYKLGEVKKNFLVPVLKGVFIGFLSNILALLNTNYSSKIYIFKKR